MECHLWPFLALCLFVWNLGLEISVALRWHYSLHQAIGVEEKSMGEKNTSIDSLQL